jgi:hypothetical protein
VFAVARWKAQGQKMSQIQKKDLPPWNSASFSIRA